MESARSSTEMLSGAVAANRTAPDPTPLLRPRSVAIVGASDRPGSYGDNVLRNLAAAGYEGGVWGVNPNREMVHGRPCVSSVGALPEPVDAVVVAIPAPAVAPVLAEAVERGCGGAVVISAGFGEIEDGAAMERELAEIALKGGLPVCGPNCDGIVSTRSRAPLWGDSVEQLREGPVALISQSGNVAVNALGMRRGIGFHTVVSTGNQAVLEAGDWIEAVAGLDGVGSIALFLEEDGDGARLARALARCAEREIGVTVLKVGSSEAGARAAGAHTGAVAGDQRVFSALLEEAGAAEARDPQELLELARCLAHSPRRRAATGAGLAVLTCSGGDSGLAGDLAEREGLPLPELAPATRARLTELLPDAATVGNPLDYTTMLWDETDVLEGVAEAVGSDPGIDRLLLLFDEPEGLSASAKAGWDAVRAALLAGAERSGAEPLLASTVPDLLPERSALELAERGIPAAAGLREAIRCAAALSCPAPSPERLEQIAAAAERVEGEGEGEGGWLGEAEAKRLLADAGVPVPRFGVAADGDAAAALAAEIGGPVAVKLSAPDLRHKSEAGAIALGLEGATAVREASERLLSLPEARGAATLLVEAMADGEAELLIAARRDGVVPALVVGLGGIWTEALDDVAIVPLPASPERVEKALRELRGAAVLRGRGSVPLDLAAAAAFASRLGGVLLENDLDLIEVNPALLGRSGCVAVDALAREASP
ncbi:MAG TPA: acetate--CoA ligase family protein [Solirubrobacterales bacterium]